jgi:mannose-1-phosphate guanylyltransferase
MMNFDHCYAVIMAGGGGTRLWPLSRQARPKQMAQFFEKGTLFQLAVHHLLGLFTYDRIYVVTIAGQAADLMRACPEIPVENFLIEPQPKGTASVIGLAAVALAKKDSRAIMAVLTADHFIQNDRVYHNLLRGGAELASQNYLVTMGITPTYPATGYGYIQYGEQIGLFQDLPAFIVKKFKEKPAETQARSFLESGDHAWNSGMFVWRVDQITAEFSRQMPELASGLNQIADQWESPSREAEIQKVWPAIKPQTIDYGIMENANRVAVIPAKDLGWSDVGSWDSFFEVLPTDDHGNVVIGGEHIGLDTMGTLICTIDAPRLVATIGVNDLIIVDTRDSLLVCSRSQAQKVRQLVSILKEQNRTEYL